MWGTFSNPTYISVGDPYVDPRPSKLKQSKGVRQFQTGPSGVALGKKTKFERLFAGEKYVDFYQMKLAEKRAARAKQLAAPRQFTATVATHKFVSGSYNGCFGKMDKWMGDQEKAKAEDAPQDPDAQTETEKEKEKMHRRPIYTSPSKKGGFGVPGTLIGGHYQWKPKPNLPDFRKKSRLSHQAAVGERPPFNASSRPEKTTFDEYSERIAASRIYSRDAACLQVPKASDEGMTRKQAVESNRQAADKHKASEKAFMPTNPAKHGQIGSTFQPFPEYMEGEYVNDKQKRANLAPARLHSRAARQAQFNDSFADRKPFTPPSWPKSGPTQSVAIKRSAILRSIGSAVASPKSRSGI